MAGSAVLEPGMYSFDDYNPSAIPHKLLEYKLRHGFGNIKTQTQTHDVHLHGTDNELRTNADPVPMALGGDIWSDILQGVDNTVSTGLNIFGKVAPFMAMM